MDIDLDGCCRAKAHHLADDVSRLEGDGCLRQSFAKPLTQSFLKLLPTIGRRGLQSHPQHGFMLAAGEQIDRVHRVGGRLHANEGRRDVYILRPYSLFEKVQVCHLVIGDLDFGGVVFRAQGALDL